jgi:hypothetical protein
LEKNKGNSGQEALKVNKGLETLFLGDKSIGNKGAGAIAKALKVNRLVTHLDLAPLTYSRIQAKGALQVNHVLTTLNLRGYRLDQGMLDEIERCLAVNGLPRPKTSCWL